MKMRNDGNFRLLVSFTEMYGEDVACLDSIKKCEQAFFRKHHGMKKFVLLLLFCLIINPTYACRCDSKTIEEAFSVTPYIFHGKVVRKEVVSLEDTMEPEQAKAIKQRLKKTKQSLELIEADYIIKVEIEVKEVFKGNGSKRHAIIYTTMGGGSCGYNKFEIGKDYIVYGYPEKRMHFSFLTEQGDARIEREGTFWTNHCTRTTFYNSREAFDLRELKD
jgi:hypothetical protein